MSDVLGVEGIFSLYRRVFLENGMCQLKKEENIKTKGEKKGVASTLWFIFFLGSKFRGYLALAFQLYMNHLRAFSFAIFPS